VRTPGEIQDVLGRDAPVVLLTDLVIKIGEQHWPDKTALIADAPVFNLLDLADKPAAMIGPGLLQRESLAIDFENHRLYIAPKTD